MATPYASQNPCLPMVVSAFILNEAVASDPDARIAPINQPNYSFLRLKNDIIQNDAQDPFDLHYSFPATNNSRLYDIGRNIRLDNRIGAYVSWSLPKVYRSGTAAAPHSQGKTAADKDQARQEKGFPSVGDQTGDYVSPVFRFAPTRWLVVRLIDKASIANQVSPTVADKLECVAWVIDSDLVTEMDLIPPGKDLQVDFSPFINTATTYDNLSLLKQAEVFMGRSLPYESWNEVSPTEMAARPQLSVLNASNPIFADFQPHNSNVFSVVDNFNYTDDNNNPGVLKTALASYYVIGWHSKQEEDPFFMTDTAITTLQQRLDVLNLNLSNPNNDDAVTDWLGFKGPARSLCHGAIYNVEWDIDKMPSSPAKATGQYLQKNQPVAVGTTATDTILSYVHAHMDTDSQDLQRVEEDIWNLGALLLAQDDGVDKKEEAQDMVYSYNFERIPGGKKWHLAGQEGTNQATPPTPDQIEILRNLNYTQIALDSALRTEKQLKWSLFSEWWKYVSSQAKDTDASVATSAQANLTDIITRLTTLRGPTDAVYPATVCINSLIGQVAKLEAQIPVKTTKSQQGAEDPFYKRKDPTLLVGGAASGWPEDYLNKLKIRLGSQVTFNVASKSQPFKDIITALTAKLPGEASGISTAVPSLLAEFFSFSGPATPVTLTESSLSSTDILPLYHDQGPLPDSKGPWRDQWGGAQPWWPLLLEWQAEYFHIPISDWELAPSTASKWEYQIKGYPSPPLWEQSGIDKRTISGRMLMLPQPSFSLGTAISRLFQNVKGLPLDPTEQDWLLAHLPSIPYLSSPMSGLTDHLVTLCRGTHIKPSQRPAGAQASAMDAAVYAIKDLLNQSTLEAFTADQLSLIGQESQQTPYGDLVRLSDNSTASPFKPATHGQMRFTQINIIDKFGQAVCVLDPDPIPDDQKPHIKPILGEVYAPQEYLNPISQIAAQPNVVDRKMLGPGENEFVQLPPGINQDSRLNFSFMFHNKKASEPQAPDSCYWEPCGDFDTPIWGWVLLNYVDYGLQFFDSDGKFYREVRLGGINGDVISSPWKPFGPPTSRSSVDTARLDSLLAAFTAKDTGPAYLTQFFEMIELALGNPSPPPSMFASYLQSVVGRPFALTTFGISLELALDEYVTQAVETSDLPPYTLLSPTDASQKQYKFPVKLGDAERPYDGLVGYWNTALTSTGETDFSNLYTYFAPRPAETPTSPSTIEIAPQNLPVISSFFASPDTPGTKTPGSKTYTPQPVETIMATRLANYSVFSAIMDPFVAIHAYSGILPVGSLQLPQWTIAQAMQSMTAFFHYGPLLVTQPVPKNFDPNYLAGLVPEVVDQTDRVAIPALKSAKWAWLQPYQVLPTDRDDDAGAEDRGTDPVADKFTQYAALAVTPSDQKPRYEKGPYTAVEGYLQLLEPLMLAEE